MPTQTRQTESLKKFDRNEIQLLWYCDYWDGPINGLCVCRKEKFWYEMIDDQEFPETAARRYFVVKLSPQQLTDEENWHELFRQKVGTHCDYGESHPEVKPQECHQEFYEAYQKRVKPDYSGNPVIGWFELSE